MKSILRLLLPRWRFFEAIGHTYKVYYEIEGNVGWSLLNEALPRKSSQIFWNPRGNFRHAFQSCLEQLAMEIPQHTDITHIPQLHTIQKIIQDDIFRRQGPCTYRFKITALLQNETSENEKDLVISSWENSR